MLYEGLDGHTEPSPQAFKHIEDPSTFGLGTLPRTSGSGKWSGTCGYALPYACPNSPNALSEFENATSSFTHSNYFNSKTPQNVVDGLKSGLTDPGPSGRVLSISSTGHTCKVS